VFFSAKIWLVISMIRKDGYFVLDGQKSFFKDNPYIGCVWFHIEQKEYMFKYCGAKFCYNELFYERVARALNIPTVHYDLAKLRKETGVITESFNPNHCKEVSLKEILEKFYDEVVISNITDFPNAFFIENTFNLEDVWQALVYYYRDYDKSKQNRIVSKLMSQLVDSFILQICTGNPDMHFLNVVVLDGEEPELAPNFDYGRGGSIFSDDSMYVFQVAPLRFSDHNSAKTTIQAFLGTSSEEFRQHFIDKVSLMPSFDSVISSIEMQTEVPVPNDVKEFLFTRYNDEQENIKKIIHEFQNANGIKR